MNKISLEKTHLSFRYSRISLALSVALALVTMSIPSAAPQSLRGSGMLSKEQLVSLFDRFISLTSQSDVKSRIVDAVKDKQEAVAITTAIQEEIFLEMGIDPRFGIACLGKVNTVYENDKDLMLKFYRFVAKEEMSIDEAELEPDEFAEKMHAQQKLQEQQLEMLKHIRKFHPDDQSAILAALHKQMEGADFDSCAAFLKSDQIQEIVRRRTGALAEASRK